MIDKNTAFDRAIEQLLLGWQPKLGSPTCGAGCSRCCQRSTVIVATTEALRVLDYLNGQRPERASQLRRTWGQRIVTLRQTLNAEMYEDEAIGAVVDLGDCVFLEGDLCGVYRSRPDTCRSFYVWHSADRCGRAEFDMCSPAELKELRIRRLYETLMDEVKAERIPFWGHLLVMIWILDQYRDAYEDGRDLSQLVEPIWSETGLVRFFEPRCSADRLISVLNAEQTDYSRLFAEEPWPLGQPRAADVSDRSELNAFSIDIDWLRSFSRHTGSDYE